MRPGCDTSNLPPSHTPSRRFRQQSEVSVAKNKMIGFRQVPRSEEELFMDCVPSPGKSMRCSATGRILHLHVAAMNLGQTPKIFQHGLIKKRGQIQDGFCLFKIRGSDVRKDLTEI